jgi:hypothetical protein
LFLIAQGENTMIAPSQFETKRASAQSSAPGPTSAAGKETVSKNALVHGLAGRTHAALRGEEDAFAQYVRAMCEDLAPVGAQEDELAESIAADCWRLRRARNMENALFTQIEIEQAGKLLPAAAQVQAWVDPSKGLQRLALYANRIQRAIEKNTAALEALQSKRKAAHEKALQEAILLTEVAQSKNQTYDPAPDFPSTGYFGGFVYSTQEIACLIDRASRLEEAKSRSAQAA